MSLANFRMLIALLVVAIAISATPAPAQTFTVLHAFTGGTDGQSPSTGLLLDHHGNLYGTTYGVLYGVPPGDYGTLFKIDKYGKQTILHRFHGQDGANPEVGHLIRDEDGNLYGVTDRGGTSPGGIPGAGGGTVFKFDLRHHKFTTLYTFTGLLDGDSPRGTLVRDKAGNIFGTTLSGGTSVYYGTVFKLSKNGKESVLHNFQAGKNAGGVGPQEGLIADRHGNMYGVDSPGGDFTDFGGNVFKITPAGKETTLYAFTGGADGGVPLGELLRDEDGNLYGTTYYGGTNNVGTIFKLDPTGIETVLHSFAGGLQKDGANPTGRLIRDEDGNFYGTTWAGGTSDSGTVFKMDPTGQVTILYSFPPGGIGAPPAGVVRDENGNLFGVTIPRIFPLGFGAVFELTP